MHPYVTELFTKAHIDDLRREAEQDRLAAALPRRRHDHGRRNETARRHHDARRPRTSTPAATTR